MRIVTFLVLVVLSSVTAIAQGQAPLTNLRGVSDILVRSRHQALRDRTLGQHVEARLRSSGLLAPPGTADTGRLFVEVVPLGQYYESSAYEVRVSLEETVTLDRLPDAPARVVTWQKFYRVGDVNTDVSPEAVLAAVDSRLDSFIDQLLATR